MASFLLFAFLPEHGDVLQGHLRRPVLADRDAAVGSGDVDVGLGDDAHPQVVEGSGDEAGERGDEHHGTVAAGGADADLR